MPELIFSQEFSFVQLKNNLKMLNLYLEKAFADIHEQLYSYLWNYAKFTGKHSRFPRIQRTLP